MIARLLRRRPRVAIAMLVKNEARFLAHHLRHHHALGAEACWIFFDGSTDGSTAIAAAHPWVESFLVDPGQSARFPYIADLQRACMDFSVRRARERGIDWLLAIDPDEFIDPGPGAGAGPWLRDRLARIPSNTWMVRFDVREAVPLHAPDRPWFESHRWFQTRPGWPRSLHHPLKNLSTLWTEYLGHNQGKAAIRTNAPAQAYDAHRWTAAQWAALPLRPEYAVLPTESGGILRHFPITGPEHWLEKYRSFNREPAVWICQKPVEPPKQWWKELAAALPAEEASAYYRQHVAAAPDALAQACREGWVEEVPDFARRLAGLPPAPLAPASPPPPPQRVDFSTHLTGVPVWENLPPGDWSPALLPPARLRGFHPVELLRRRACRWAGPGAAILLAVPPGSHQGCLDTGGLAPKNQLRHTRLRLEAPGWQLRTAPGQSRRGSRLEFHLTRNADSPSEAWLEIEAPPFPLPAGETRDLRLPVTRFTLKSD